MTAPGQSTAKHSKEALAAQLKAGVEAWNKWRSTPAAGATLDLSDTSLNQSDLTGANLAAVNLSSADLSYAKLARGTNLWKANLSNAFLDHANLRGANLSQVNFTGATLDEADLRDSNLGGADLSNVKGGLLPRQLAGADLTGTKLPEPLANLYDKLGSVSDISDSAKKLFLALLAACLYSWLTIATTKDVDLITNRASSPLPVIQTAIPIVGFYVVAPLILLCIYFYFHFYLQKLWEELATLPAVFTDGRPLYARADPWLFNDLVRAHFPRLKEGRPFLSYFQQRISVLLAWWIVPVTLLLFWGRYLPRHDLFWTIVLAVIFSISVASAIQLYRLAKQTLGGHQRRPFDWKRLVRSSRTYRDVPVAVLLTIMLIWISTAVISDEPPLFLTRVMSVVGGNPNVNFENAEVSTKPANWTGKEEDLEGVKQAILGGRKLSYANASHAFLAKADLGSADLHGANLAYADLRQANLSNANLTNANLFFTDLRGANLAAADLTSASLQGALITYADLRYIRGVSPDNIKTCRDWELALFDFDMHKQLGLRDSRYAWVLDHQIQDRKGGQKLCRALLGKIKRDSIIAPENWTINLCSDFSKKLGGTGYQLGCLTGNGVTMGAEDGSTPPGNTCEWK